MLHALLHWLLRTVLACPHRCRNHPPAAMVGEKRDVSEFFQVVDTGMGSFHSCMAEFMQGYSVGVATKVESLGQIISPVTSEEGKLMTNLLAKSAAAADAKRAKDEPSV